MTACQVLDEKEIKESIVYLQNQWKRPIHPDYTVVHSLDEAVNVLRANGAGAHILAGGIDTIGLMRNRILAPELLVNIKSIETLGRIRQSADHLAVGANLKIAEIEESKVVSSKFKILSQTAGLIGSPQIRNMGTLAGNLCQQPRCWYYRRNPDTGNHFDCRRKNKDGICYAYNGLSQYHAVTDHGPCAAVCPSDMATALLALDAEIVTLNSSGGRKLKINELYGPLGTVLDADEIITEIRIPESMATWHQRFFKYRTRKAIDYAIVSAAVNLNLDGDQVVDARIVLGGVANSPHRAHWAEQLLKGNRLDAKLATNAAIMATKGFKPLRHNQYKVQICQKLVFRGLLSGTVRKYPD